MLSKEREEEMLSRIKEDLGDYNGKNRKTNTGVEDRIKKIE